MKQHYILFLLLLFSAALFGQAGFVVKLKDKKNSPFSLSRPSAFLSNKAIERRVRHNIVIDSSDLPVNPDYVRAISQIPDVHVVGTSRWLNQVMVVVADEQAVELIRELGFVTNCTKVTKKASYLAQFTSTTNDQQNQEIKGISGLNTDGPADTINYGNNFPQVHLHEGEYLHKLGYSGQGMLIAMLDAGYSGYKTNPAFDSLHINNRVVSEWDFVKNEPSVNEDHSHGANCLSIMAANQPAKMVGTAPHAQYILFRTEDANSETPAEEQNWIQGAERADSLGADIISSSLGYTNFDDATYNHAYQERDGNTSMITQAADMAARKGILVVTAAGNSGNDAGDTKYVMCPADADSVLSVGAVSTGGTIGTFSSWGPNGAGKLKPNVVSVGWNSVYTNPAGNTATNNGTSSATPNMAGLVACLWQAFGEFTNMDIIDAVQRSAHLHGAPNNRYGYGIPDFKIAYQILEAKREEKLNGRLRHSFITAYPVPFKQQFTVYLRAPESGNAFIRVVDMSGRVIHTRNLSTAAGNYYTMEIRLPQLAAGIYYLHFDDGKNKKVITLMAL